MHKLRFCRSKQS